MTVCIAAVCEQGRVAVAATDGASSFDGQVFDIRLSKMRWLGEWMFLHSGFPSNFDLMTLDLLECSVQESESLRPENIIATVHAGFRRRLAAWASDRLLMPLGTNLAELREKGVAMFGEKNVGQLMSRIIEAAEDWPDQLLLVGWGHGPRHFILHEENKDGSLSHVPSGFAAIGSGAAVAMSQLHLLGQAPHSTLEETLYRVAAAKFTAEHAEGVGVSTTFHVTWKQRPEDGTRDSGRFLRNKEKDTLRAIWHEYGNPRMPDGFSTPTLRTPFTELSAILRRSEVPAYIYDEETGATRNVRLMKDKMEAGS
ncbi:MAG: hypothetical protein ACRD5G_09385 [Candidatus Acidiferrales bacterium]